MKQTVECDEIVEYVKGVQRITQCVGDDRGYLESRSLCGGLQYV